MLYISKKTKNVKSDRYFKRTPKKENIEVVVVKPVEIKSDVTPERIEPTVISVENKRKPKKVEKVDKEENDKEDGRE